MTEDTPKPEPQDSESGPAEGGQPESAANTAPAVADGSQAPTELIEPTDDEKTIAMLAHLLGLVTSFVGALIILIVKKDDSKFIADQSREALNFQITIVIGMVVVFFAAIITICIGAIGGLLAFPLAIYNLVYCIIAGLKAKEGVVYRYPFALRLIK